MQSQYTLIHLTSPYNTLSQPLAQKYYASILAARIESYQLRYGENVLPFGSEDILCDFIAVERNCDKKIVASFKCITFEECLKFSVEFPLFHTLSNPINPVPILQKVQDEINLDKNNNLNILYMGSLTLNKTLISDDQERKWVKKLISLGVVQITQLKNVKKIYVTGTIPNGSSHYIKWLGFSNMVETPVTVWDIGKTTAFVMSWQGQWSLDASNLSKDLELFWNNRIFINKMSESKVHNEAA